MVKSQTIFGKRFELEIEIIFGEYKWLCSNGKIMPCLLIMSGSLLATRFGALKTPKGKTSLVLCF